MKIKDKYRNEELKNKLTEYLREIGKEMDSSLQDEIINCISDMELYPEKKEYLPGVKGNWDKIKNMPLPQPFDARRYSNMSPEEQIEEFLKIKKK